MSETSVTPDSDPFPLRLVLATAVCVLSLPFAAMAGVMGLMTFDTGDAVEQMTVFSVGSSWPILCVLGPVGAWGAYLLGARRFTWAFLIWPLLFDLVGVALFLKSALDL